MNENSKIFSPVKESERILLLDFLRGFAVLGILLVNIEYFANPMQIIIIPPTITNTLDNIATMLIRFLAEGKFYSIFSFLFGYGFSIMMFRAEKFNISISKIFTRRLLFLLIFGLMHILLFWIGDILTIYALVGFFLLLFKNKKPKTLIVWIIILLILPFLFTALGLIAIELGKMFPPAANAIEKSYKEQEEAYKLDILQAYNIYANGNFSEIFYQRLSDIKFLASATFAIIPGILAMFLTGFYFGKRKIFQEFEINLLLLRKICFLGLILGVAGNLIYTLNIHSISRIYLTPKLLLAVFGQTIGFPALSLFYITGFGLLFYKNPYNKIINLLAPVGKLALTNYLMHSIIFTTVFYGYGLGLYGKVGKSLGILMGITMFIFQILFSNYYIKKFRYGPFEWLWRIGTYFKNPKYLI